VCYTRSVKTKIEYVGSEADHARIESEDTPESEWTLFNDDQVLRITGNIKQIVEDCVTARH